MGFLRAGAVVFVVCALSACAGSQGAGPTSAPSASAAPVEGPAASLDVNVANTIVRVSGVNDGGKLRSEVDEFKAGLHWSRGTRPTDAVITIVGEDDEDNLAVAGPGSEFGQTVLYGTVSLVDVATGDVVVAPINLSVEVGKGRDSFGVGLTNDSKLSVELEYLVQKFILAGREALYGKGV